MSQLEQLEAENEQLNRLQQEARLRENDLQAQLDQIQYEYDLLKRKGPSQASGDFVNQLQEQLQEKEFENERARNEIHRLRHELDRAGSEMEKLHSKLEFNDQMLMQRDQEKNQF